MTKITHTRMRISAAAQRLVEGKLFDRAAGVTDNGNDVYQKIVDAIGTGVMIGFNDVHIVASKADCHELIAEMDWALDGYRDIDVGERSAARALRKKARDFAAILA